MFKRLLLILICTPFVTRMLAQHTESFNSDWEFVKGTDTVFSDRLLLKDSTIKWEKISLPHTANIEPVEKVAQQWQGVCYYRKFFSVPAASRGKHIALQFDAAMQQADVYLNGKHIYRHLGGYLPFYIDVSDEVTFDGENSLLVMLDNRDNPLIPPGKPLKDLDFNYYSGIYRNAWLIIKDKLYLSDPVAANTTAGGGVFLHYENIGDHSATLVVQTEVKNDHSSRQRAQIKLTLSDRSGRTIAGITSKDEPVEAGSAATLTQQLSVPDPHLWSPDDPYLYRLSVEVVQEGKVIDQETIRTGIRTLRVEAGAVYLNGKKIRIRGTNRHQDYPYIGNALSDNAQYRDAWKIKQAGFNFVRSSHYPQSPAYLDACDELGLMVMDATPGWQFFSGNDTFWNNSFQNIRDMIRRDRNHPSIIFWEASLNETRMKKDYMEKANRIVHEELPFKGIYSAGWIDDVYDVFIPARQHGKAPDYWKKYPKNKPILLAEYGDWEYYAQNAGFNQKEFKDLKPEERTSRQLRGFGEKRLLQQALNYQQAHNDDLYGPAIGDVNWLMFDYNRGYATEIQSSGIMDIQRLPKFSFYFFQSQVDPVVKGDSPFTRPMLFIANYWQDAADTVVKIYSNCEEVALLLNGTLVSRQRPDTDVYSTNLKHPPFTFHVAGFQPGTLTAIGYIHDEKAVEQQRKTPGAPAAILLRVDKSGRGLSAGQNDVAFVYADIVDSNGTIIPGAKDVLKFSLTGDAEILSPDAIAAEAGTATLLVRAGATAGKIIVAARGKDGDGKALKSARLVVEVGGGGAGAVVDGVGVDGGHPVAGQP